MPKILIVEDELALVRALKAKLVGADFDVSVAYDGEEAKNAVRKKLPDLILLDILLPKLSGIEYLVYLKKSVKFKSVPVLILSNYSGEEIIKQAMEAGAADYLIKSNTSLEEVIRHVNKILKK